MVSATRRPSYCSAGLVHSLSSTACELLLEGATGKPSEFELDPNF